MSPKNNILPLIEPYQVISIIGMAKNVGKTTTLNYLIKIVKGKSIGLTSIGRDGEKIDLVTSTQKPQIYVDCGTIIATATQCLNASDFTKQILETTNIHTPLGRIVIVKALSDGFVDLAGPSTAKQLKEIIQRMKSYGPDFIFIDGAINRKVFVSSEVSDALILCTGAAYLPNMKKVIDDTLYMISLLQLEKHIELFDFKDFMTKATLTIIKQNKQIYRIHTNTALSTAKEIRDDLKDARYLLVNGALTDRFLDVLIQYHYLFKQLTVILPHATSCLVSKEIFDKLAKVNINLRVLHTTKLLFVSINPTSPYGYDFNEDVFLEALQSRTEVPIYNVMRNCDD